MKASTARGLVWTAAQLVALAPLFASLNVHAAPDVIFIPGEFPDRCALRLSDGSSMCPPGVSTLAPNLCDLPLPNLQAAAAQFGVGCAGGGPSAQSDTSADVELVLLVDDRGLTIPLERLLTPVVDLPVRRVMRTRGIYRNLSGSVVKDVQVIGENTAGLEIGAPVIVGQQQAQSGGSNDETERAAGTPVQPVNDRSTRASGTCEIPNLRPPPQAAPSFNSCYEAEIAVPNSVEALEDRLLDWMRFCVASTRVTEADGTVHLADPPPLRDQALVRGSQSVKQLWFGNLEKKQGQTVPIYANYTWSGETGPRGYCTRVKDIEFLADRPESVMTQRLKECVQGVFQNYNRYMSHYTQQMQTSDALCTAAFVPGKDTPHLRASSTTNYPIKAIGLRDALYSYVRGQAGFEANYCAADRSIYPPSSEPRSPGGVMSEGVRRASQLWYGGSSRIDGACPAHPQDCPPPPSTFDSSCRALLTQYADAEIVLNLTFGSITPTGEVTTDLPPIWVNKPLSHLVAIGLDFGLCSLVSGSRRILQGRESAWVQADAALRRQLGSGLDGDGLMCSHSQITREFMEAYTPRPLWLGR